MKELQDQADINKQEEEGVKWPGCPDGLAVTFTEVDNVGRVRGPDKGETSVWDMLTSECLKDAQMEIHARQLYKPIQSLEGLSIDLGGISTWAITAGVGLHQVPQQVVCERLMPGDWALRTWPSHLRSLKRVQRDGKTAKMAWCRWHPGRGLWKAPMSQAPCQTLWGSTWGISVCLEGGH